MYGKRLYLLASPKSTLSIWMGQVRPCFSNTWWALTSASRGLMAPNSFKASEALGFSATSAAAAATTQDIGSSAAVGKSDRVHDGMMGHPRGLGKWSSKLWDSTCQRMMNAQLPVQKHFSQALQPGMSGWLTHQPTLLGWSALPPVTYKKNGGVGFALLRAPSPPLPRWFLQPTCMLKCETQAASNMWMRSTLEDFVMTHIIVNPCFRYIT